MKAMFAPRALGLKSAFVSAFFGLFLILSSWLISGCSSEGASRCVGAAACACYPNGTCDGLLVCNAEGTCGARPGCAAGVRDCTCDDAGACEGQDLACRSGVCSSTIGDVGSACFANRTCNGDAQCENGTCVSCTAGTEGCPCRADQTCASTTLACDSRVSKCVRADLIDDQPPALANRCFTPCRADLASDAGVVARCGADGLIDGCLPGSNCVQGTCVAGDAGAAGTGVSCTRATDCPSFQTCVAGSCASTCDYDSDCGGVRRCHLHVCREPCDSNASACAAQNGQSSACTIVDGTRGFCMPTVPASAAPQTSVSASFSLDEDTFRLTNRAATARIKVHNDGLQSIAFTLRKREHREPGTLSGTDALVVDAPTATPPVFAMPFVRMAVDGGALQAGSSITSARVVPGAAAEFLIDATSGTTPAQWEGVLEVASDGGVRSVRVSYASSLDGRWAGTVHLFSRFDTSVTPASAVQGDETLAAVLRRGWTDPETTLANNALVAKWRGFVRNVANGGGSSTFSLSEWDAVVSSTVTESWRQPQAIAGCPAAACYLTLATGTGLQSLSADTKLIPTGAIELPFAIDVAATGSAFVGAVDSNVALDFPGSPLANLQIDSSEFATGSLSLRRVTSLTASSILGARTVLFEANTSCSDDSAESLQPWLVDSFAGRSTLGALGTRSLRECRDKSGAFGSDDASNRSFSYAQPVADGRRRFRSIELLDGALVNGTTLLALVRQKFGVVDGAASVAYGVMRLEKAPSRTSSVTPAPTPVVAQRATPEPAFACSDAVVKRVFPSTTIATLSAQQKVTLAQVLVDGQSTANQSTSIPSANVHYLCVDTGTFDGLGASNEPRGGPCPAGSSVVFFAGQFGATLPSTSCGSGYRTNEVGAVMARGICTTQLEAWRQTAALNVAIEPAWRCTNPNEALCEADRYDLRAGKSFYAFSAGATNVTPLATATALAFRYRTQFTSRSGDSTVGFTPTACPANSTAVPYCYDAPAIESVAERLTCLYALQRDDAFSFDVNVTATVRTALREALSKQILASGVLGRDGFERLNAELLVMLGDDALTKAAQSRFDLAGQLQGAFPGDELEVNGVRLGGALGFEMRQLYRAAQTYQLALDRFFNLLPWLESDLARPAAQRVVSPTMVDSYLARVLRASVQRSRAWAEIGRRYASLGRADLARLVMARAYTAATFESAATLRLLDRLASSDGLAATGSKIAVVYRVALADMRKSFGDVRDGANVFGFAPEYIPFPSLAPGDANAFTAELALARDSVSAARIAEDATLSQSRSYEVDSAQFQSQLVSLRNNYENQLSQICGTFTGLDGRVYPAIRRYAGASERTLALGNPCGLMGRGQIYDALIANEQVSVDAQRVRSEFEKLIAMVDNERERAGRQCGRIVSLADFTRADGRTITSLQGDIANARNALGNIDRAAGFANQLASLAKCTLGDCVGAVIGAAISTAAYGTQQVAHALNESMIESVEASIRNIQDQGAYRSALSQCDSVRIDSEATIRQHWLSIATLHLDALRAAYEAQRRFAAIGTLRDQATRLEAEQSESLSLAIDVEAARNDPNVRIYKNDAVLTAERTFDAALKDAYKLTRVFEYYTSQTYAGRDSLNLVRMVGHGDVTLEGYLRDLQSAYQQFSEANGRPDQRVDILSLRDDVLAIPLLDSRGVAIPISERVRLFREELKNPARYDGRGYLTLPFATGFARLSPLTRNHKILYVESEVVGANVGDALGRVYVSQFGTAAIRPLAGVTAYYRFAERTAVVNPFFNGRREFTADVYRNDRLRDRPFINSNWEIVLNQRDELVNQDIDLNALTDIKIYVYYTDFTAY